MQERRATRDVDTDRRTASRIPVRCDVEFLVGGVTYCATAEDLSVKGVFVATEVDVFDGLPADVSLYLDNESEPIKIVGTIARLARRRDERPGFAVEFGSIDEATQARIRSAVQDS